MNAEQLIQDVKFAVRALRGTPGFSMITVLILAVTIGANSSVFTLMNALLLRELPVRRPDQLVQLFGRTPDCVQRAFSLAMFDELERRQQVFSGVIVWTGSGVASVEIGARFTLANLWSVDGRFYEELGQRPQIGRLIGPADANLRLATADSVVVLGDGFWQREFGGDPAVIGRELRIEGEPFTIVGVTAPGFGGMGLGEDPEITIPLPAMATIFRTNTGAPIDLRDRRRMSFEATGRLKDAIAIDQARAQLEAMWPELLEASVPSQYGDRERQAFLATRLELQSASRGVEFFLRARFRQPLIVLMGVAALMLVIACVHLASLTLARAASRAPELGLRLALGASRWRVCRQFVLESVLLSLTGAALGLLFAKSSSEWMTAFMTQQYLVVPRFDLRPDAAVVGVTVSLAVASGVLFALAPVWFATRQDPGFALQTQSRRLGRSTGLMGQTLIVAQVSLSLVVVTDAALLAQSVSHLRTTDPGFRRDGLLIARLMPQPHGYDRFEPGAYYRDLLDRIRNLPGVVSAAVSRDRPANAAPPKDTIDDRSVFRELISPGFFEALGIPVVRGRDFRWSDDERGQRVGVISKGLAASLFAASDPIGQHVRLDADFRRPPIEIVGVVEDARLFDLREPPPFIVFLPATQQPALFQQGILEVNVAGDPLAQQEAISRIVDGLGREYLHRVATLNEVVGVGLVPERMTAGLAAFLSSLAIALACVGLYGLMSYTVQLGTREIGIRMALGAPPMSVMGTIVGSAARLVIIGVAAGVPLSLAAAGVIGSLLFGIGPRDPMTIAGVSTLLVGVGALAAYIPARRASLVDPMIALRCE